MIVWGTKFTKRHVGSGSFFCPRCSSTQEYKKLSAQKYGHVYWIPLFSMDDPIEYVECQSCQSEWKPTVLQYSGGSPSDLTERYLEVLKQILVGIAVADGELRVSEVEVVQRLYAQFSDGSQLSEMEITAIARGLDAQKLIDELQAIQGYVSDEGKEYLVKAGVLVAYADGTLDDDEATLLGYFSTGLGMSGAHIRGVIQDLAQEVVD